MQRLFAWSFILLLGASMLALPHAFPHAYAQVTDDSFTVTADPAYPAPYQTVQLQPSSTQFDIASAKITVTANGSTVYSGTGGKTVSVPLGGPGSVTSVTVSAVAGGQTYTQKFTFRPAQVALVVEPFSTTHAFYEGRGLVSPDGTVRLVAIPDLRTSSGAAIDPSTLIYTWKKDDQILESDSGIGNSVLTAQAPERYRDVNVTVTVATQDGTASAQATTSVSPVDPLVRIYRNDPLLGPLFNAALSGSVALSGSEDTFRAVPYYFAQQPKYDWTVNGADSAAAPDITVRSTGSGQGSATLGFQADGGAAGQQAQASISTTFGTQKSLGIFGI